MARSNVVEVTIKPALSQREVLLRLLGVFQRGEMLLVDELNRKPHRCSQCGHEE